MGLWPESVSGVMTGRCSWSGSVWQTRRRRSGRSPVVRAQAGRHQRGAGAAERGGLAARSRPSGEAAQEAGGEGVAASGGVDDVDLERRAPPARRFGVDDDRAVGARGGRHAADAAVDAARGIPPPGRRRRSAPAPARRWAAGSRGARSAGAIQSAIAAACSPGASRSAEVTTPCSRAKARILRRLLAAHELGRAEVQVGGGRRSPPTARRPRCRWRWRRRRGRRAASRRDGSAARWPRSAPPSRRTSSAVSTPSRREQVEQHVAERVGPDRPGAADLGAELGQRDRRPAGRPGAVIRISSTSWPPWPCGNRLDRAHEHVEHVHPQRDHPHRSRHSLRSGACRSRARRRLDDVPGSAASRTRGGPTAAARQYRCTPIRAAARCSTACIEIGAVAIIAVVGHQRGGAARRARRG